MLSILSVKNLISMKPKKSIEINLKAHLQEEISGMSNEIGTEVITRLATVVH